MSRGGSVAGGVVLIGYAAIIALGIVASIRASAGETRVTWRFVTLVLAVLALDKALHLESLLESRLEATALAGGWYAGRQPAQRAAIVALALAGAIAAGAAAWVLRRAAAGTRAAGIAAILLAAFVAIRAVSFHTLDRLFSSGIGPLRLSNVVELGALAIIGVAAASAAGPERQPPRK